MKKIKLKEGIEVPEDYWNEKIRILKSYDLKIIEGDKPMEIQETKTVKILKVMFSEKEKVDMAGQIANSIRNLNRVEDELASISAEYRSEIKKYQIEIKTTAQKLNTGWEMRSIPCIEKKDYDNGSIQIFRNDTQEMIEERAMTAEERQMTFFDENESKALAGEKSEPGVEGAEATPEPSIE
jgi:hypothetical protein